MKKILRQIIWLSEDRNLQASVRMIFANDPFWTARVMLSLMCVRGRAANSSTGSKKQLHQNTSSRSRSARDWCDVREENQRGNPRPRGWKSKPEIHVVVVFPKHTTLGFGNDRFNTGFHAVVYCLRSYRRCARKTCKDITELVWYQLLYKDK